ncbi:hypothetical protein AM493_13860 [Flavobacterium akiainvivens]|uniref:Uncharacterized protein n=1 Tax=Flavobacterium akiainvivens TaxID=1202724 RepID=A0A0M8MC17_9FLAO|nr:hypothetical protein [Flavobacterium akiainvivens]KOS06995.1 hypothetical protein AM493_13860 [Flavobacterium akiainvivens]SFQ59409.1 hypothetical protein SAMN05444144_109105 [Flavobacterium akiainvivens]
MPDFTTMDIATLTRSITGGGERYLTLFLREYTTLFPGTVNPACPKCLAQYLTRYKQHYNAMANTSHYRLHAKYENIPLEFGSPILVNNANMTDEYAQKLLSRPGGERLFAQIPPPTVFEQAKMVKAAVKKSAQVRKKRPRIPLKPELKPQETSETSQS